MTAPDSSGFVIKTEIRDGPAKPTDKEFWGDGEIWKYHKAQGVRAGLKEYGYWRGN